MSKTPKQNQKIEQKNLENLPIEMQSKISFMLNNPDVMIFKPSDSQKGSTSSILYGYMSNIDRVKTPLADILNFKIEVEDLESFFKEYIDYGKDYHQLLDLLKKIEIQGVNLLAHIKDKNKIRDRRLRERVISNNKQVKKEDTVINAEITTTNKTAPVVKKTTGNKKKIVTTSKKEVAKTEVAAK